MKWLRLVPMVCLAAMVAPAQKKEVVELQRDVALLQDQVRTLQTRFDEKIAALTVLLQQTLDAANKANTSVAVLDNQIRGQLSETNKTVAGPVAVVNTKLDTVANTLEGMRSSVDEMTSRMTRMQTTVGDLAKRVELLQAPPPKPPENPAAQQPTGPPAGAQPDLVYQNALRDRSGGNLDLAYQEFSDFLKWWPTVDLAPNAQYYIGDIHYTRQEYDQALEAFTKVIEGWPDNPKTADAIYMRGQTLLKQGSRNAAIKEFQDVISIYPTNPVAAKAKQQLSGLGVRTAPRPAAKKKR